MIKGVSNVKIESNKFFSQTYKDVIVNTYNPKSATQRFKITGSTIVCLANNYVLDVDYAKKEPGTKCLVWKATGATNQQWQFMLPAQKD